MRRSCWTRSGTLDRWPAQGAADATQTGSGVEVWLVRLRSQTPKPYLRFETSRRRDRTEIFHDRHTPLFAPSSGRSHPDHSAGPGRRRQYPNSGILVGEATNASAPRRRFSIPRRSIAFEITGHQGGPSVRDENWKLPVYFANFVLIGIRHRPRLSAPRTTIANPPVDFVNKYGLGQYAGLSVPKTRIQRLFVITDNAYDGRRPMINSNSRFLDGITIEQGQGIGRDAAPREVR